MYNTVTMVIIHWNNGKNIFYNTNLLSSWSSSVYTYLKEHNFKIRPVTVFESRQRYINLKFPLKMCDEKSIESYLIDEDEKRNLRQLEFTPATLATLSKIDRLYVKYEKYLNG